jgi:hypothetical protein
MNKSPTSFQNTRAWGPKGIPVVLPQFRLGNKAYTVLAAYTYHGFLEWSVFEGAASGSHVEHFIRANLAGYKNADSISFCDNASVNKVDKVFLALDKIFGGLWAFLAAYSPQLAPVELGFSNIREYIRSHELSTIDPVSLIDEAFQHYSVYEESGRRAFRGNWNKYINNHQFYLDHMLTL